MTCPHTTSCQMYSLFASKSALEIWKTHYCNTDKAFATCARYQLACQLRPVPITLLPNGSELKLTDERKKRLTPPAK